MKYFAKCLVLLALATISTRAQELVPRSDAVKLATRLNFDLSRLQGLAIPTDADTKRAVAAKDGEYGAMAIPETKLSAQTIAQVGKEVVPIGQLWTHKLTIMVQGEAVPDNRLNLLEVEHEGSLVSAPLFLLGVRQAANGNPELLFFGKGKEPLLTIPLKAAVNKQAWPIEFAAEKEGDSARVTLKLAGKYEAVFSVTEQTP